MQGECACVWQNMDYEEGTVKGTDVVKELRARGCVSAIFIRSASDDFESMSEYLQAGATGSLSKETRASELIAAIQSGYHAALQRRALSLSPNLPD